MQVTPLKPRSMPWRRLAVLAILVLGPVHAAAQETTVFRVITYKELTQRAKELLQRLSDPAPASGCMGPLDCATTGVPYPSTAGANESPAISWLSHNEFLTISPDGEVEIGEFWHRLRGEVAAQAPIVESIMGDLGNGNFSDREFGSSQPLQVQEEVVASLAEEGVFVSAIVAAAQPPLLPSAAAVAPPDIPVSTESVEPIFSLQSDGPDAICPDPKSGWPPEGMVQVLRFGVKVREILGAEFGLESPQRRKILVIDTGFGKGLVDNPEFARFLYRTEREVMLTPIAMVNSNAKWRDADDSGYYLDVVSAAVETSRTFFKTRIPSATFRSEVENLTFRIVAAPGDISYAPYHGSYVATLTVGGPEIVQTAGDLARLIGVRAFRLAEPAINIPGKSVSYNRVGVRDAIVYAKRTRPDVVNLSLTSNIEDDYLPSMDAWGGGLLVAAAGNVRREVGLGQPNPMPQGLDKLHDDIIVVAAFDARTGGLWASSAYSKALVHIAAPGVNIASYDDEGKVTCQSGTSAAAPLVSFTAGVIGSLSGEAPKVVRARILSSSRHIPGLVDFVEQGRVLDAVAAADIFVDRLYMTVPNMPGLTEKVRRGWIIPSAESWDQLVATCTGPKIDLNNLWSIERTGGNIQMWLQPFRDSEEARPPCGIAPGNAKIVFFDLEDNKRHELNWWQISRIVPSPYRANIGLLMEKAIAGELPKQL